ncbi:hypothetical protein PIB30_072715 [Stylosanthes scabra]|uniref:Transposase n=1 Tax=Stylosanthes scabra TaxID=79078 RepID=A0ABU6QNX8_9FABA|nr:hypothetical protein [Stylosanthes scabra]
MEEREEVTFDIGGPIGPAAQSVSNLTSFVGIIGRNKRFVTLLYTNWHVVPQNKKKSMWRFVNTKFILPASAEKWVMQTIRDAWKRFKAISERNKKNKKQQKFPHRMGPVNFARVQAALRESKGTNEEPKRFEVFIATRTSRKRKELDEGTQTEMFHSRQASGETEEEAFQSLFGKEQPGQVRCYGRSVTQIDLQKHVEISALKHKHQEEVTTLRTELGDVKTQQ